MKKKALEKKSSGNEKKSSENDQLTGQRKKSSQLVIFRAVLSFFPSPRP